MSSREQVKEQLQLLIETGKRIHTQELVNGASADQLKSIEKSFSRIESDILKDQKQSRSVDKLRERMVNIHVVGQMMGARAAREAVREADHDRVGSSSIGVSC